MPFGQAIPKRWRGEKKKARKQERRSSKREKEKKLPISRKVKKIEKQTVVYSSREKFDEITRKKERKRDREKRKHKSLSNYLAH